MTETNYIKLASFFSNGGDYNDVIFSVERHDEVKDFLDSQTHKPLHCYNHIVYT